MLDMLKLGKTLSTIGKLRWCSSDSSPARKWPSRFEYQSKNVSFDISEGDTVLDVGSGSDPFPLATHLCDLYEQPTRHRETPLVRDGRPFVHADITRLPFQDKYFDYVYCCHVLEHVDDPVKACKELQRVGKRGYIETPRFCKDALMCWAKGMHRWHVTAASNTLIFIEYTEREIQGIRSTFVRNAVHSRAYHPLQDIVFDNPEIFNVMFTWDQEFRIEVFRLSSAAPEVLG